MTSAEIRKELENSRAFVNQTGEDDSRRRTNAILFCIMEFTAELAAQLAERNEKWR